MKPGQVTASRTVPRYDWQKGVSTPGTDQVAEECPLALVYNGVSHVVMMATPTDLEDFALGFSLTEGILQSAEQLLDMEIHEHPRGLELHLEVTAQAFAALKQRRRNLVGRTGCGLCGAESLEQAMPTPVRVTNEVSIPHSAVQRALASLRQRQALKDITGSVHAAAYCNIDGDILLLREDVGRHNALDKLLGALHRCKDSCPGLVLVTSRASYEMVAKTASANIAVLAAVSAPTSLALEWADAAGITLLGYVGEGRHVIYTQPERIVEEH